MKTTAPEKSPKAKKRILLVDDHPVMRDGFAQLINHEPDLHVCAQAATPTDALQLLSQHKLHLAIVDLSLGDASGLTLVRDLLHRQHDLPVLVLTMHDESLYAERVLRAGARGFVMKQASTEEVLSAIRTVLSGVNYVSDRIKGRMLQAMVTGQKSADALDTLSDREMEVFQLIGKGRSTREIGEGLSLSIKTIETYRMHLKEKLDARTGAELGRRAVEWTSRQKTGKV